MSDSGPPDPSEVAGRADRKARSRVRPGGERPPAATAQRAARSGWGCASGWSWSPRCASGWPRLARRPLYRDAALGDDRGVFPGAARRASSTCSARCRGMGGGEPARRTAASRRATDDWRGWGRTWRKYSAPLEQFVIKPLVPLHVGTLDLSYTNSALLMTIVVGLITAAAGRHDAPRRAGPRAAAVGRRAVLRIRRQHGARKCREPTASNISRSSSRCSCSCCSAISLG